MSKMKQRNLIKRGLIDRNRHFQIIQTDETVGLGRYQLHNQPIKGQIKFLRRNQHINLETKILKYQKRKTEIKKHLNELVKLMKKQDTKINLGLINAERIKIKPNWEIIIERQCQTVKKLVECSDRLLLFSRLNKSNDSYAHIFIIMISHFFNIRNFLKVLFHFRMGKRSLRPRRNGDNGDSDTNAAAGRKR